MWNPFNPKPSIQKKLYPVYIEIKTRLALPECRKIESSDGAVFFVTPLNDFNYLDFHSNLYTLIERLRNLSGEICITKGYASSNNAKRLVSEILFFISLIQDYLNCWAVSFSAWWQWAKISHGEVRALLPKAIPFKHVEIQRFFTLANPEMEGEAQNLRVLGTQLASLINSFDNEKVFDSRLKIFHDYVITHSPTRVITEA